ncbi:putative PRA1 (Prenylated rab acceptor) family protein [Capsicum annuum]|nr:putative PRA1 (Prenylated rab acceptor) family protein [Capsicum annuum]
MPYYNIDTQRDIVIATMAIHNYIRKKCNVYNAFQMAKNERYIPSVDFDVGTTSMANNIDDKNSGAKVYVKPSEATPWRDDEATLLFNAADNGNAEIIKCLLQAGGDPNIIDEHGNKPIQVAAIRCNRAAVKVLLPVTQRILSVPEWSVDGVIEFMQYEYRRRQLDGLFEYMDSYYYSTRVLDLSFSVKHRSWEESKEAKRNYYSKERFSRARKKTADEKATGEEEFKKKTEDEKAMGEEDFKKKAADEKATGEEEFKKKATDVKARREEECKKNTADAKVRREEECKKKAADAKARGEEAFKKKDFAMAVGYYTQGSLVFADNLQAINFDPTDSTLFSNRSLCWIRLGEAEHALCDAKACRKLGPDWAKAYYREEAANVFYEGLQIDPRSKELVTAFRESIEADRRFHGMSEKNLSSSKS